MRSLLVVVSAWSMPAAASCKRPLGQHGEDAGDAGVAINRRRRARGRTPRADVAADAPRTDAPRADIAGDLGGDARPRRRRRRQPGTAVCPANVPPLDVCGCGRCGGGCTGPGPPTTRRSGESRDDIPNPVPPPPNCAMAGGSVRRRVHVCCADPGTPPGQSSTVCAQQHARRGLTRLRFRSRRRDGVLCTTVELGAGGGNIPIMGAGA